METIGATDDMFNEVFGADVSKLLEKDAAKKVPVESTSSPLALSNLASSRDPLDNPLIKGFPNLDSLQTSSGIHQPIMVRPTNALLLYCFS